MNCERIKLLRKVALILFPSKDMLCLIGIYDGLYVLCFPNFQFVPY